jgi:predicted transcriptional regulator of viral defense system
VSSFSAHDAELVEHLQGLDKVFVARPEDDDWLLSITPRPDLLMSQAVRRGSLLPLGGGRYVPRPPGVELVEEKIPLPLLVAARLFPQPCSLAYRSALARHGLIQDREPSPATFAVRGLEGTRISSLFGQRVRLVRVDPERFGGHEEAPWHDEGTLRLRGSYLATDLERTLVDCLDKPRLSGSPDEIAKAFKRAFKQGASGKRVADYAADLGHSTSRRAAFWLDKVGQSGAARSLMIQENLHSQELAERHLAPSRSSRGRPRMEARPLLHPILLDSTKAYDQTGQIDTQFGVVVNLPNRVVQLARR